MKTTPFAPSISIGIASFTLCVSLAGCGGDSGSTKPAMNTSQPVFTRTDQGIVTQAVITDDRISMPAALPPGPTVIKVVNNGKKFHNFRVIGDGIDNSILDGLQPNQTGELFVNFHPGKYIVVCPSGGIINNDNLRHELTVTQ